MVDRWARNGSITHVPVGSPVDIILDITTHGPGALSVSLFRVVWANCQLFVGRANSVWIRHTEICEDWAYSVLTGQLELCIDWASLCGLGLIFIEQAHSELSCFVPYLQNRES